MATTEDIARLILESTTRGFPDAKKQIDDLEAKLDALKAQYSSGAIDIDAYFEKGQKLQGGLDQLKGGVKAAEDAIKRYGDTTKAAAALAGQAQSRVANFGQAALQSGRVLQDFIQGGIGGILNNIEGLSVALGGGAGLAGVLTIVGTALFVFKPKIEEFFKSFLNEAPSLLGDRLMALKKQIDDIEKKPIKLSADITELENARKELAKLEEARKAFEEFGKLRPEPTKVSGEQVQKALAEAPGGAGAVREALEKAAVTRAQTGDQATEIAREQARQAQETIRQLDVSLARPGGGGPMRDELERQRRAQQERLKTALDEVNTAQDLAAERARIEIGAIYKGAAEGDVARQRELQEQLKGVGKAELAKKIRAVSPENIRAKQLEEEGGKLEEEARKELAQAEKERAEDDAKHIEEQLHNRDVIEKQLSDATDDARKKQAAAEKRRLATLTRRIGGGTLGEEAEAYAARVQERQPGISDADLRAEVSRAVAAEVARRAPQLAPAERAGVTTAVTEQALAAPPEDVAARQAREARAAPRQQQAGMAQGYAQEAQMRGFNPQAAAEIGRRASAAFAKTGDLEGSFMEAIAGFQQVLMGMQQHQQRMAAGLAQVQANNAALRARQPTAQWQGGFH
jgi:hypothetical protein